MFNFGEIVFDILTKAWAISGLLVILCILASILFRKSKTRILLVLNYFFLPVVILILIMRDTVTVFIVKEMQKEIREKSEVFSDYQGRKTSRNISSELFKADKNNNLSEGDFIEISVNDSDNVMQGVVVGLYTSSLEIIDGETKGRKTLYYSNIKNIKKIVNNKKERHSIFFGPASVIIGR